MMMNRKVFRAGWISCLLTCLCVFGMYNVQKTKAPSMLYVTHDGTAPTSVYTDEADANNAAKNNGLKVFSLPFERHK